MGRHSLRIQNVVAQPMMRRTCGWLANCPLGVGGKPRLVPTRRGARLLFIFSRQILSSRKTPTTDKHLDEG